MKFNRKITFLLLSIFLSFAIQTAYAQEEIIPPSDLFPNFPEIKWGMSLADAKKAIEKIGKRAARPVETELTWLDKFREIEGRGSLRFTDDGKLNEIVVQTEYSDKGNLIYEVWLKKLTEKYGSAKETVSEDVTSKFWKLEEGFSIELRLVKGDGENYYMADIHWVKS